MSIVVSVSQDGNIIVRYQLPAVLYDWRILVCTAYYNFFNNEIICGVGFGRTKEISHCILVLLTFKYI